MGFTNQYRFSILDINYWSISKNKNWAFEKSASVLRLVKSLNSEKVELLCAVIITHTKHGTPRDELIVKTVCAEVLNLLYMQ